MSEQGKDAHGRPTYFFDLVWPYLASLPDRVRVEAIAEQRALNWRDFHPETYCHRCGRRNVWSWAAPSPLWNAAMRRPDGSELWEGIVCPSCFAEVAEPLIGRMGHWRFWPEGTDVSALWTDPDGRVWNPETWLWEAKP